MGASRLCKSPNFPCDMETDNATSGKMSPAYQLQFLQQVQIFKEIANDSFLTQLASNLEEVVFPAHQTIFTQGEEGHLLYFLVAGKVKVHIDQFQLAQLEPGSYFGEMALFDSQPRSASVEALEDCKCLVLTRQQVYEAMKESPSVALNMIRVLCQRVRKLNRLFGASEDLFYSIIRKQLL